MFWTPGWGALLTAVSTVSGVAITQWNATVQAKRQSVWQRAEAQRQAVLDAVLDVVAATDSHRTKIKQFAALVREAAADREIADLESYYAKAYEDILADNNALKAAVTKSSLIISERAIRRAMRDLESVDKTLIAELRASHLAAKAGTPETTAALEEALTKQHDALLRLLKVTREQLQRKT